MPHQLQGKPKTGNPFDDLRGQPLAVRVLAWIGIVVLGVPLTLVVGGIFLVLVVACLPVLALTVLPIRAWRYFTHDRWANAERRRLAALTAAAATPESRCQAGEEWLQFGRILLRGRWDEESHAAFREAVALFEAEWNPDRPDRRSGLGLARTLANIDRLGGLKTPPVGPAKLFRFFADRAVVRRRLRGLHDRLLETHPNDPDVKTNFAGVMLRHGDTEGAIRLLNEVLDQHPGHEIATGFLRDARRGEGRFLHPASLIGPLGGPSAADMAAARAVLPRTERGTFDPEDGPQRDPVDCTVFAPPQARPGDTVLVQVFLHAPEEVRAAAAEARAFDADAARRGRALLATEVARGSRLAFRLTVPGLGVDEPVREAVWRGLVESVQFAVSVPPDAEARSVVGTLLALQDNAPVGQIKFKLDVVAGQAPVNRREEKVGETRRFRQAFASYASADRPEVLRRVQVLRAAGIRCFQDVLDLDPGQRWERALYRTIDDSDVLFLFWSAEAMRSEWVEREWRYGLERKGDDFILPVPIEGPPPVPPPPELAHLHFNDPLLCLIATEDQARLQKTRAAGRLDPE